MISFRLVPHSFIAAVLAATTLGLAGCGGGEDVSQSDRDKAVDAAQAAYRQAGLSADALAVGPCISESLPAAPDWVADVAHDPREAVDEEAANQCRRFRSGEAHHFVELAPDGQLIKAQ